MVAFVSDRLFARLVMAQVVALLLLAAAAATPGAPAPGAKNFFLIAVDDLRPMFGESFGHREVLTPNIDKHFTKGGGAAMQRECRMKSLACCLQAASLLQCD